MTAPRIVKNCNLPMWDVQVRAPGINLVKHAVRAARSEDAIARALRAHPGSTLDSIKTIRLGRGRHDLKSETGEAA